MIIYIERGGPQRAIAGREAPKTNYYTIATFKCDWIALQGVILEPGDKAGGPNSNLKIPAGTYSLYATKHRGKRRKGVWKVKTSPDRGILLHEGVDLRDTEGCLLVAKGWNGQSLIDSPLFTSILTAEIAKVKNVKLVITDGKNPNAKVGTAPVTAKGNPNFNSKVGTPEEASNITPPSNHPAIKAAMYVSQHVLPKSQAKCALYWRRGYEANGFKFQRKGSACDYIYELPKMGFEKLPGRPNLQAGDIVVWPAHGVPPKPPKTCSQTGCKHGHIEVWDGSGWCSDFKHNKPYPGALYKNVQGKETYWRHKDLLNSDLSALNSSTATGEGDGEGSPDTIYLNYNPDEAMKKANEAAKALFISPKEALAAVQDLPILLKRRAEVLHLKAKGKKIDFALDINTETEIEAVLNAITVAATHVPGMEVLSDNSLAYTSGDNKKLVERVYPRKYFTPFYADMFDKESHRDLSVRPLYFWPQPQKMTAGMLASFDAPSLYQTIYDSKKLFSGKEAEGLEEVPRDTAEGSWQMVETRYIKDDRGTEKKYLDEFNIKDLLGNAIMKLGVPAPLAKGVAKLLGNTVFLPLTVTSDAVSWITDKANGAINAIGEGVFGNTVSQYTGEFPAPIKNVIGSLQASSKANIAPGHPPELRAIADLISRTEFTHEVRGYKGYGEYLKYTAEGRAAMALSLQGKRPHPQIYYRGPHGKSSAAGRYQYVYSTWKGLMGAATPMTVANQDAALIKSLKEIGVYDNIIRGDFEGAFKNKRLASTWASIPLGWSSAKALQGKTITGQQWVEAAKHLTLFYKGVKADGSEKVKTDGPNVVSRTIDNIVAGGVDKARRHFSNLASYTKSRIKAPAGWHSRETLSEFFKGGKAHTPKASFYQDPITKRWHAYTEFRGSSFPPLVTPLPGTLTVEKNSRGAWIATVDTDVTDLKIRYLSVAPPKEEVKGKRVVAGEVVAMPGKTPTGTYAVYIQGLVREVPFDLTLSKSLAEWPVGEPYALDGYLASASFSTFSDVDWVKQHSSGKPVLIGEELSPESPPVAQTPLTEEQQATYEQMRGHQYAVVIDDKGSPLADGATVFSSTLIYTNVLKYLLKPFEYANSQMLPQIKGYTIIGNEDDDYYVEGVPIRQPIIYEMPLIQSFSLSCNDDYNPVDVARFVVVNPAHLSTTPMWFDINRDADIDAVHTQFYAPAYLEKARIRAGTKVSFKLGYTSDPNSNPTVFNGVIKEVGGAHSFLLECIAEGYGSELLNAEIGSVKPINYTNGHNASTGAIFGISLLNESISHFGARIGTWRYAKDALTSIFRGGHVDEFASGAEWANDTIFEGKGKIGDMRDPENKALVAPWSWGDNIFNLWFPTRANAANRVFMNIFSDVIESIHDTYATDFIRSWLSLFSISKAAAWRYFAYKSTPWSIMKEMEYRHPGTLCKPMIYDERMTLFYGMPFQNYIARDLSPHFMMTSALVNRWESLDHPFTDAYLQVRASRMEPVTKYHLLHSDVNIITNAMSLSRDFYTRVNVSEYNRTFEPNDPGMFSEEHEMTLDDNIRAHDLRTKSLSLGGCHKEYNAWLYGTQELKKEVEKMYKGTITVIGNPHIKAGDYAYLEDRNRGLSGTIKIRECVHHFTEDGYVTVITPGLWAEPSQFSWSNHLQVFNALGRYASDIISEVSEDELMERLFGYQAVVVAAASYENKTRSLSDVLLTAGLHGAIATWAGRKLFTRLKGSRLSSMTLGQVGRGAQWLGGKAMARAKLLGSTSLKTIKNSSWLRKVGGYTRVTAAKWNFFRKAGPLFKWLKASRFASGTSAFGRLALSMSRGLMVMVGARLGGVGVLNPIALGLVVATMSFVSYRLDKNRLTRQPIVFVPIMHNHTPYVAGIDGFSMNTYFEAMKQNLKEVWKSVVKAGQYYAHEHFNGSEYDRISAVLADKALRLSFPGGVLPSKTTVLGSNL